MTSFDRNCCTLTPDNQYWIMNSRKLEGKDMFIFHLDYLIDDNVCLRMELYQRLAVIKSSFMIHIFSVWKTHFLFEKSRISSELFKVTSFVVADQTRFQEPGCFTKKPGYKPGYVCDVTIQLYEQRNYSWSDKMFCCLCSISSSLQDAGKLRCQKW